MEYMRLEGVLGGAVSKLINKAIAEKFGYRPNIMLERFTLETGEHVTTKEGMVLVKMEVAMREEDFNKIIEEATK